MKIFIHFKKIICFILLYTIFIINASTFYVFGEETSTATETETLSEDTSTSETNNTIEDSLNLSAQTAVLIDAKTGIVMYDKLKDTKVYPASVTKIMTALLTIENTSPSEILTFSHNAVFNIEPGSSHIGMREGEEITIEQALYGLMLASANEVAMGLAEHVSGTVDEFVKLMNSRAKEIGANNTNFVNPHGLHDENHYTTSYDIALIMKEAIKNEDFVKYISTKTYTIPTTNLVDEERILNNSNKLILPAYSYYYEYCIGGKTGYTSEAGNTLVAYAKKDDMELISVVMNSDGAKSYTDITSMFEYGFSNFEEKDIFDKDVYKSKTSVVQNYNNEHIPLGDVYLVPENSVSLNLPSNIDLSKIQVKENISSPVIAPLNTGDSVGTLDFIYEENTIYSVKLLAENNIDTIDENTLKIKGVFKSIINIILKILKYAIIVVVSLFIFIFVLSFITRRIYRYKRNKRKYRYMSNYNKSLKPLQKNNKKYKK